ncbi:hypothetical protein J6590_054789 [Homalodisca vitripennis]|nr:hypothetical protein J6590_054789 [Homalodisca vitripennis]
MSSQIPEAFDSKASREWKDSEIMSCPNGGELPLNGISESGNTRKPKVTMISKGRELETDRSLVIAKVGTQTGRLQRMISDRDPTSTN